MRYVVLIILAVTCLCAEGNPSKPERMSFDSVATSLKWLSERLMNEDFAGIYQQTSKVDSMDSGYIQKLAKHTKLTAIYKDSQFPKDRESFKLGGHTKEIGCMHIDYRLINKRWYLYRIWQCR